MTSTALFGIEQASSIKNVNHARFVLRKEMIEDCLAQDSQPKPGFKGRVLYPFTGCLANCTNLSVLD